MTHPNPWSRETVQARLDEIRQRVAKEDAETRHVFTQLFSDPVTPKNLADSPLSGALVSIKDLLDVAGHVTRAGTVFMEDDAPAAQDADVVARLRAQGCVFVGHTNMTELAFSGLGLNPHYGTPENALYPGCIPGGSTSGGAISVVRGLSDFTIGTDTGGSLRIPAAFNGITGFKPTQSTVSRRGCYPLSNSLDSIGPMARDVATCRAVWQVIANPGTDASRPVERELVIPENFGMDDLDAVVAAAFDAAVDRFQAQGFRVTRHHFATLDRLKEIPGWHFSAVECRAAYEDAYQSQRDRFDPRVAVRMARADGVSAVEYCQTLDARAELIRAFDTELAGRVLLMPTVPTLPPTFAAMEDDAEYGRANIQALRNPTIANVMDGCSLSLPFADNGNVIGVMLIASGLSDEPLLDLALDGEAALA